MKVIIISDAWSPQINGVVRTYENICSWLSKLGYRFEVIHPGRQIFKTVKMPGYEEIDLVINPWKIKKILDATIYEDCKYHIATEGPLGLYARYYLSKKGLLYTTSFHTLFPEFIEKRFKIPSAFFYPYFRWFHKKSKQVLVPTKGIKYHLEDRRFTNLTVWSRGVDSAIFNPHKRKETTPYIVCVSRVSQEKGLDEFCKLKYTRKVLIGDGPYYEQLRLKYPDVEMIGVRQGGDLASWVASADVFVFPSKTDTFGIVILEALACGTPVAAYDQPGPREVIKNGYNGYYGDDLQDALDKCLKINRKAAYTSSLRWTWEKATKQFIEVLQ